MVFEQKEFNFFMGARPLWTESYTVLPFLPVVERERSKSRLDLIADPYGYGVCGVLQFVINDPENHFSGLTGYDAVWVALSFPRCAQDVELGKGLPSGRVAREQMPREEGNRYGDHCPRADLEPREPKNLRNQGDDLNVEAFCSREFLPSALC